MASMGNRVQTAAATRLVQAFLATLLSLPCAVTASPNPGAPGPIDSDMHFRLESSIEPTRRADHESTDDHSKFEALQWPFNSGPEVTRACLEFRKESLCC